MIKLKLFLSVILMFFLLCIFALYKQHQYGSLESYWHSSPKDCEMVLPSNMKLVYSNQTKKYAIQIDKYGGRYKLYLYLWAIKGNYMSESLIVHNDFSDSCKAKSFAAEYIRQKTEENSIQNSYK